MLTKPILNTIGWNFDNSYTKLQPKLYSFQIPETAPEPTLALWNDAVAKQLGLNFSEIDDSTKAQLFSGNKIPDGAQSIAQAYAGHQFGHFTMLGDGRAILLGEQINKQGQRYDIQLKGSGQTPYSRRGDGKATLYAMLREYITSEAMHALGIPTSRSLAIVSTGEKVYREFAHDGAVLTRVALSHIRVGTFEYVKHFLTSDDLETFTNYVIERHYPELKNTNNKALALLIAVMDKQIDLIVNWMRVGFIHGVMNTDNMSIAGETIDYGPCAFMNAYNPSTVFSSIDTNGRYAYGNQPAIAQWNLACFAGTLLPIINANEEDAVQQVREVLSSFVEKYQIKWLAMMCGKLGLEQIEHEDNILIEELLQWMQENKADYTYTFAQLRTEKIEENSIYSSEVFKKWLEKWQNRILSNSGGMQQAQKIMSSYNPFYIPRNHLVENTLTAAAYQHDYNAFHELLKVLSNPYHLQENYNPNVMIPAKAVDETYNTYCGT